MQLGRLWGIKSLNVIRDRPDAAATQKMKDELMELGATQVITESELLDRSIKDRVKEWTSGGREAIKVGLNCVGGKPTSAMVKLLGQGGHLVTYGGMARAPLDLPTGLLIFKDLKFSGFWVSRWAGENLEEKKRTVEEILEWTRKGEFKDVPVSEVKWEWGTEDGVLKEAVAGTLGGFRGGKGVFVFGDT